ncbi:carboxy-S-adenosyl-L-methionine synthase CmoA [Methylosarcina fibrata]|uniref:carboxy-S-adenosyl-L-methionine synthase CmoA n=1 Tax=Methylosarcina fibrata TaxID=105972 RepID=UPI000369E9A0|nr:carboxy-S-adenosyl-L-methionine synthase CmoA [Methylosarcina fibrata]
MTQEDRIFQHNRRVEDFAFDERVAAVFDNMVSRSVPFYSEIQRLQSDLIVEFLSEQDDGVVCDLGCSTGTTIEHIINHPQCSLTAKFVGLDNSEPMLDKARTKLSSIAEERVSLLMADLGDLPPLPVCNVVILNWTLQFVRPIGREHLLKNIHAALKPGGALFLSEKILSSDAALNRLYIDHYLQFKKSQSGYTDTENQRKREALENVLIPYRLEENIQLLERAGFKRIDTYFRWLNFACLIAIK